MPEATQLQIQTEWMGIRAIPRHIIYFMPCMSCLAGPFSGLAHPVSDQQLDFHFPRDHVPPRFTLFTFAALRWASDPS